MSYKGNTNVRTSADGDVLYLPPRRRPIIPQPIADAASVLAARDDSAFARAFVDGMGDPWSDYVSECEQRHMRRHSALRGERVA